MIDNNYDPSPAEKIIESAGMALGIGAAGATAIAGGMMAGQAATHALVRRHVQKKYGLQSHVRAYRADIHAIHTHPTMTPAEKDRAVRHATEAHVHKISAHVTAHHGIEPHNAHRIAQRSLKGWSFKAGKHNLIAH